MRSPFFFAHVTVRIVYAVYNISVFQKSLYLIRSHNSTIFSSLSGVEAPRCGMQITFVVIEKVGRGKVCYVT